MSAMPTPMPATERELSVDEIAARLGVPVTFVIRRIEAGDLPARRIDSLDGSITYRLRAADLGDIASQLTLDDSAAPRPGAGDDRPVAVAGTIELHQPTDSAPGHRESAETPPPGRRESVGTPALRSLDAGDLEPASHLMSTSIDVRELVAGLLDRWERTLEQRIHADQRQRFEAELTARQAQIRHLQLELEAVRAQQAASLADRDRIIAEHQRLVAERDNELLALRASIRQRPRGWLFRRY